MISTTTVERARPGEQHKCVRCNVTRTIRPGHDISPLCRDCRKVLSPEETARWLETAGQDPLTPDMRANLRAQAIHTTRNTVRNTP